ncbi:hypothetical protein DL766_001829 [Monosporascus sp. MC13-8B]|nr:hypothetical protein DL763_011156 [Monosporascus cannonballus]RYP36793.1 hypothetical protein DL766_001829 [Monosporascus sp. MC13-8B]
MITGDAPSIYDDGSDAWMALPLFNRKGSPDHTRNVLAWQPAAMEAAMEAVMEFDIPNLDCGFFHDYEMIDYENLTPSHSCDLSRPQSEFAISAFQFDAASHSSDSSRPQSEFVVSTFQFDAVSHSSNSSRPQSEFAISAFQFDAASYSSDSSRPQSESVISASQSDAASHPSDSYRPQSEPVISSFQSDSGYESHVFDQAHSSRRRSLDEISDEHIPQPVFTTPCQCTFQNCKSTTVFTTGRDFRRHYRQHFKRFFCRYEECPQSRDDSGDAGTKGFATRKDRARHEAKHNPAIKCPWQNRNGTQCTRTFSRMDNMRDHYRRIHEKACKT